MKSGLAKSGFLENYQKAPWKTRSKPPSWPWLDRCLAQKKISHLDYLLTHRLLRHHQGISQEVACCICHLIMAAREGHLCIQILEQRPFPDAGQLWQEEGDLLSEAEIQQLNQFIIQGAAQIPPDLMADLSATNSEASIDVPLCRYGSALYLQRHWTFETLFIQHLNRHCASSPFLALDAEKVKADLLAMQRQGSLLVEQAQAIENACLSSISLMTGGPGTGKTYTAGQLIKVFWSNLSSKQRERCEIALAAPTGKAVANLQKSLGKVAATLEGCPPLVAKTLHSLLGIRASHSLFAQESVKRLTADLIVVDESSMIDIRLMAALFEAIKEGARLVLIGDCHQLPSVEAGSVFADLLHVSIRSKQLKIPCTQLQTCLRTELSSIIDFAKMIKEGEAEQALAMLNQGSCQEIQKFALPQEGREREQMILDSAKKYFPAIVPREMDPQQILSLFQTSRILSPLRKGPLGVDALNQLLGAHFSQVNHQGGLLAIPILVTTNDYRQDLFNGETGVLVRKLPLRGISTEDYALFPSRENDQGVRKIAAILLPKYEYAYCLSVHKSQGSEFDRIILVMPEGSELFGREVLYTAVTRARKQIEIYGNDSVLSQTIQHQGLRLSGIVERLN